MTYTRDPFKVNDRNSHIASWGYRSWIEHCLRMQGVTVSTSHSLETLERILSLVGGEPGD